MASAVLFVAWPKEEKKRVALGGSRSVVLAGLLALGVTSASAGDARTFKLSHPAARCGDAFAIEQKTSFVLSRKGGPEKGHIETRSSYKVKVVGTEGSKVVARFEIDPTTTTSDMGGETETTTEPARTLEATLDPSEATLLPVPTTVKTNPAEGLGILASKDSVTVGDTWTAERAVPVARGFAVPVKATYTVASVEKDPRGRDLLRVVFKSEGSAELEGSGGVRLKVSGEGSALFDPERSGRPLEVRLSYRFATSGGEGADSESRTETTITTTELASVASPGSASSQEKTR